MSGYFTQRRGILVDVLPGILDCRFIVVDFVDATVILLLLRLALLSLHQCTITLFAQRIRSLV